MENNKGIMSKVGSTVKYSRIEPKQLEDYVNELYGDKKMEDRDFVLRTGFYGMMDIDLAMKMKTLSKAELEQYLRRVRKDLHQTQRELAPRKRVPNWIVTLCNVPYNLVQRWKQYKLNRKIQKEEKYELG